METFLNILIVIIFLFLQKQTDIMNFFEILAAILNFAFFSFATAYVFGLFTGNTLLHLETSLKNSALYVFFSEEKSKMTGLGGLV